MHISVEFDGKWMKAEVVAHVPAGIKVKFVDDGDVAVVPHLEVAARIKGNVGLGEGSSAHAGGKHLPDVALVALRPLLHDDSAAR